MRLHVGQGTTRGALTVFPVWSDASERRQYVTDPQSLAIAEVEGGPAVSGLGVTNVGKRPVFVAEGHLFEGGWQHRMARASLLVAAGASTTVQVACVEQRRWGGAEVQSTRGRRATPYVRSVQADGGVQSEIWRRVERYGASETGSLAGHLDAAQHAVYSLTAGFRPLAGQSGVLVGIGGEPLMLEVFDDPRTLREQFDSIIAAAGLDALMAPGIPTPGRRARRMVERLERTRTSEARRSGDGVLRSGRTGTIDRSELVWRGATVHLRASYLKHPMVVGA